MGYEAYWAKLDLEFGAEDREALRRKLHRVRLTHAGRVSEKTWRDLFAQMSTLAKQLGDISEAELWRLLVNAIPSHPWRRKLAQEEDRKTEKGTIVLDWLPGDVSVTEVSEMMEAETGTNPAAVRRCNDRIKVTPQGDEHRNTIKMLYDRNRLQGGQVVKVSPDTSELRAKEINELMIRWLRMEQRIASAPDRETSAYERQDRRPQPRWHREVDLESEGSIEEEVRHVGKGGKRSDKRPLTPPKPTQASDQQQPAPPPKQEPKAEGAPACSSCGHTQTPTQQPYGTCAQPSPKGMTSTLQQPYLTYPPPNPQGMQPSGMQTQQQPWQQGKSWTPFQPNMAGAWNSGKGVKPWNPSESKGKSGDGKGKGDGKGEGKGKGKGKGDGKGKGGKNGGRGRSIGAVEAWQE